MLFIQKKVHSRKLTGTNVGRQMKRICCAPSSDLPSLKTGLPHLPTKPWLEVGAPVLGLGCPIF